MESEGFEPIHHNDLIQSPTRTHAMATKLLALKANEEHHISLKERGFVRRLLLNMLKKLFADCGCKSWGEFRFIIVLYNDIKEQMITHFTRHN